MGVYINSSIGSFENAINSMIYVDKTGLIDVCNKYINTEQRFICASRPRRFGKTMALAYMTGIFPIRTYGAQFVLNKFMEVSIVNPGECSYKEWEEYAEHKI